MVTLTIVVDYVDKLGAGGCLWSQLDSGRRRDYYSLVTKELRLEGVTGSIQAPGIYGRLICYKIIAPGELHGKSVGSYLINQPPLTIIYLIVQITGYSLVRA